MINPERGPRPTSRVRLPEGDGWRSVENQYESEQLRPYVPRLVVDWLRYSPSDLYREVDGTLAFVDISGFTALTERLARRGRVGAEEMSENLNATFAELLTVAYEDGAGLVKWGGDAVLLLFDGPDHAQRACRAAHRMRSTLRQVGHLNTTAGKVVLRMSVGIHSGRFQFFLVGDPRLHRELLIAGPDTSRTAEIEAIASAGEIGISAQTAALLPPEVVGKERAGAWLLRSSPILESVGVRPASNVSGLDLREVLPKPIREQLLARSGGAEHRAITVAFVQFSGTDDLMSRDGPAALASALEECIRNVQEAADRFGVTFFETDINRDGGKIMLVSGAPTSAGNDEERLLRACRLIADRIGTLPLRIGINRGGVFAGDFGPQFRRTYSVKGDAVNVAARVMGKAQLGQVLATTAVTSRSRATFDLEPLPPFMVKGKSIPIEAASVGSLVGERAESTPELPLVGRDVEVAALAEALNRVRERSGGFLVISGELGIGKSRLVREFLQSAEDVPIISATCTEYASTTPYSAMHTILCDILGLTGEAHPKQIMDRLQARVADNAPHLSIWMPLLGIPLWVDFDETPETRRLDDRFRKSRLEEVLIEFLDVVLPSAAVISIEDVHLIDDASAELLSRLANEAPEHPWLFVVTRRDVVGGFQPSQSGFTREHRLGPLDAQSTKEMAALCLADDPVPPYVAESLISRSGGNPLFLRVLVNAAHSAEGLSALPESIEDVVTSQIDRLAPHERTILRYASVLGPTFTEAQLRSLLAGEEFPPERDTMRHLGEFLLAEGHGRFRFRQSLIRDVAYEGLPFARRQALHGRVGDALELTLENPDDEAELLSLHFHHAGRFEKAWKYSRSAGDFARESYAYAEASEFYTRATSAARVLPEIDVGVRVVVFEQLGDSLLRVGSFHRARSAYRAARGHVSGDPLKVAGLLRKEAVIDERLGRASIALRTLSRARGLLEAERGTDAVAARARISGTYAVVKEKQGRYRDAITWGKRAEVDAREAGDTRALAEAYEALHSASSMAGVEQLRPYGRLALELFEELGDRESVSRAMNNLAVLAWFEGRGREARSMFEGARDAAQEAGDTLGAAASAHNVGDVLLRQGLLSESHDVLTALLPIFRGLDNEEYWASTLRWLGLGAARHGEFNPGHDQVLRARAIFVDLGLAAEIVETDTALAEILLETGHPDDAVSLCVESLARANSLGAGYLLPILRRIQGMALAQMGRIEEAVQAYRKGLHDCETHGNVERGFLLAELASITGPEDVSGAADLRSRSAADLAQLGFVGSDRYPV